MKHTKYLILTILCLFSLTLGSISAQASAPLPPAPNPWGNSVELVKQMGGSSSAIAMQGHYVYVGIGPRLAVFDVSDPSQPKLAGQSPFLLDPLSRIIIRGRYAYGLEQCVSQEGQIVGGGLVIFDLSNPVAPQQVGLKTSLGCVSSLALGGNYAYTADGSVLNVIDITDPANPTLKTPFSGVARPNSIAVSGNHAYVSDMFTGLAVLDLSNPTSPVVVASLPAKMPLHAFVGQVAIQGNYAYVGEGQPNFASSILRVIDIHDPLHPVEAGSTQPNDHAYFNLIPAGNTVYATSANYRYEPDKLPYLLSEGIYAIDVSDPAHPAEKGVSDTALAAGGLAVAPAAADGKLVAYLADLSAGLRVADVTDPASIKEIGSPAGFGAVSAIQIYGNSAYISGNGLQILDLADPSAPKRLGSFQTGGHVRAVLGKYAYLTVPRKALNNFGVVDGALQIVDVSNPAAPSLAGVYSSTQDPHDVAVWGPDAHGHTYAYLAEFKLQMIDVTDPAHPALAGTFTGTNFPLGVKVLGPNAAGRIYAYVADRDQGLVIVDVTDPVNPVKAGGLIQNQVSAVAAFNAVDGSGKVYAAITRAVFGSPSSVTMFDVTDPANPVQVSFQSLDGDPWSLVASSKYLFVASGWENLNIFTAATSYTRSGYFRDATITYGVAVKDDFVYLADHDGGLYIAWFGPKTFTQIGSAEFGSLSSAFDSIDYFLPMGMFGVAVRVDHQPRYYRNLTGLGALRPIGQGSRGHAFEISAQDSQGQPVIPSTSYPYSVTVKYSHAELGPVTEASLALYYWDGTQWVKEPTSVVDAAANTVTAHPNHFSLWAVLGQPAGILYLPVGMR